MEIVVPVVTPYRGGRVDVDAYSQFIKHLLGRGVTAIYVAGTTGLGPALRHEERVALLEAAASTTKNVIFNVSSLQYEDVVGAVREANRLDIIAVASTAPFYFPSVTPRQIVKYFRDICQKSSHPLYLYNIPSAVGRDVDVKTVGEVGCIAGVKDTVEEIAHTVRYKKALPNAKVYNGSNSLILASFVYGLDGVVVSAGNYLPEVVASIREAVKAGELEKAARLQWALDELQMLARDFGGLPAIYEFIREFQGFDLGGPKPPIYPLDEEERAALIQRLRALRERLKL